MDSEGGYPFEYLNDEAKTAAAGNAQGWLTVGNISYVDADGYLFLTDRRHHTVVFQVVSMYTAGDRKCPREPSDGAQCRGVRRFR